MSAYNLFEVVPVAQLSGGAVRSNGRAVRGNKNIGIQFPQPFRSFNKGFLYLHLVGSCANPLDTGQILQLGLYYSHLSRNAVGIIGADRGSCVTIAGG